ncbi:MAG: hypothetical protein DRJ26_01700 [Candidatus Methanomethylicota archaeon]|uniref:Uncharacterized protein n=1 Tax=Thermoproteota archaeon TaxID=2056631 RepID=A0A497F4L4_9CREN|nr:MAG: hypothetical protein DRJ26_01700 [Candidatus Verstraetearchaeota archaeon]
MGKAQVFAIASLLLSLVVLVVCAMAVQPLAIGDAEVGDISIVENMDLCLKRLVLSLLASATKNGDASILISRLTEFQDFVDYLAASGYEVKFVWRGGLYFSWNYSSSSTSATFVFEIFGGGFRVYRVFDYILSANVINCSWINGYFYGSIKVFVNGCEVEIEGCEVYLKFGASWTKLNSSNIALDVGLVHIVFKCSVAPSELYVSLVDNNGVLVRVKCSVEIES